MIKCQKLTLVHVNEISEEMRKNGQKNASGTGENSSRNRNKDREI